jgi:ribosome-associated protein
MQESDDLPERDSKSLRKKQMLTLQKIGETLVDLPAPQLAQIPLESPLAEAINEARAMTSHEGKRRQLQYIGKLMRNVDVQPITDALNQVQLKNHYGKARFHQMERWRDQLISEGDTALQDFLQRFPGTDTQQLRQLVRNAQKDAKAGKNAGADTALFRYIREVIEQAK